MAAVVNSLKYVVKRGIIAVPQISEWVDIKVLAATVAEAVVSPSGAQIVTLTGNTDFYVNFLVATTAGIPAADNTTGLNPIFVAAGVPATKGLANKTTFSVVSAVACVISMEFFK